MKSRNRRRFTSLVLTACVYGLAGNSAQAQGSIVYHNPPDHQMLTTGGVTHTREMDLDANGVVDFVFRAGSTFIIYSAAGNRSIAVEQGGSNLVGFSSPLAEGFEVGSLLQDPLSWHASFEWGGAGSGDWAGQTLHAANDLGTLGFWQPQMTGYLGVEFQIEGNVHYGWIRLTTPFFPGINGGTIHDWAYNSVPNMPILAGQVPEPGTWALLLAGGGFLWWRLQRRRTSH